MNEEILLPSLFLDTNIVYQYLFGSGQTKSAIDSYKEFSATQIYISRISLLEAVQLYCEKIEKQSSKIGTILKELQEAEGVSNLSLGVVGNDINVKEYQIRAKELMLASSKNISSRLSKFTVVEYDGDMSQEAVNRAICKKVPCSESRDEFRDTIIWLSYKKLAEQGSLIAFLTEDKDFLDKTGNSLHPQLVAEFNEGKYPLFFPSISAVWEKYIGDIQHDITKANILALIDSNEYFLSLEKTLCNMEAEIDYSGYTTMSDIEAEFEILGINCIGGISGPHTVWIESMNEKEIIFASEVEIEVEVDFSARGLWYGAERFIKSSMPCISIFVYFKYDIIKKELCSKLTEDGDIEIDNGTLTIPTHSLMQRVEDDLRENYKECRQEQQYYEYDRHREY